MTPWAALFIGWLLSSVLIVVVLYGLYSIRENAICTRKEEVEEEAVEEFRRELEERGVALFEIPEEAE